MSSTLNTIRPDEFPALLRGEPAVFSAWSGQWCSRRFASHLAVNGLNIRSAAVLQTSRSLGKLKMSNYFSEMMAGRGAAADSAARNTAALRA
jgi:hypothetical protein